jgi:glycosyltransferase involved in cell wall biosynthesis
VSGSAPVSVVISVYDGEAYLREAIESVLAQTPAPAEVIVVDDGSTDSSADVARAVGKPVMVLSRPHRGSAPARNTAVDASSQPLLGFCDADDLWCPSRLERALEALSADPAIDAVFGHVSEFSTPDDATPAAGSSLRAPREGVPGWLLGSMIVRRASFDRVGGFDERFPVGEFIDWLDRARQAGLQMRMLPDVVLLRRIHPGSMTTDAAYGTQLTTVLREALRRHRGG